MRDGRPRDQSVLIASGGQTKRGIVHAKPGAQRDELTREVQTMLNIYQQVFAAISYFKRYSSLLIVVTGLYSSGVLLAQEQWFPIGPAAIQGGQTYGYSGTSGGNRVEVSGRATVIAVNPMNPRDVWLGTANGGVWHSTDAGQTGTNWQPMTDDAASLAIGAIALKNCDGTRCNTIYIGTGEDNIRRDTYYGAGIVVIQMTEEFGYVSSQLGDTQERFGGGAINKIIVDGTTLYASVSMGRTSSGSQSTVTAPAPRDGYGIHKSTDGGATWTLAAPSPDMALPTDLEIVAGTLYAGFMGRGIFKLTSGGTQWCPLNPGVSVPAGCPPPATGLPDPGPASNPNFDYVEIEVSTSNPDVMYAVFGKCPSVTLTACVPEIYRSSDGGLSWQRTSAVPIQGPMQTYSRYTHVLAIHPSDPNTLLYGGLKLWESTDAGENFRQLGSPTIHPDHQAVAYADPSNPDLLYSANDGGFYYSLNGGDQWYSGNYDLQINALYSVGADVEQEPGVTGTAAIIGGSQDNGTNMFNGSRVWQHVLDGDGGDCAIQNALQMFASYQLIAPNRSTTGGAFGSYNFFASGISGTSAFYPPYIQHPETKDLYFATDQLHRTSSTGSSWSAISPIFDASATIYPDIERKNVISAVALSPSDPNRIYVGLYNGAIWRTQAGGPCPNFTCWQEVGGPNVSGDNLPDRVVSSLAVHPTDPNRVYVTYSGFSIPGGQHVWSSSTGGVGAWAAMSNGLPAIPANVIKVDPDDPSIFWLGTDRGVFRWRNPATGWEAFGPTLGMPNVPVYDIAIDNFRGRVYAATHGRGMFLLTTHPVLHTFEGWMGSEIWDILIYGTGFKPSAGITSCTVDIILQNGDICASGDIDAYGGTLIKIGEDGTLVTDKQFHWTGKPVIAACLNGDCVGGVDIEDCLDPSNRISSVRVTCGGQVAFASVAPDCPQQDNPPSSIFSLSGMPTPTDGEGFDVIVALAGTSTANGGDRALCGVHVDFEAGDTQMDVARRVADAINASAKCAAEQITAQVPEIPDLQAGGEDFPPAQPVVRATAQGLTGGQLVMSLRTAPGKATGTCFNLESLGLYSLNQLAIMRTTFVTAPGGAQGGDLTFVEQSPLGRCKITIPTTPGQTAQQIAAALQAAILGTGDPGLPECEARQNPHDVMLEGASLITVVPTGLNICTTDPGLGFLSGPDGIDLTQVDVGEFEPKLAASIHVGVTQPLGDFDTTFDPGLLAEVDLEYRFAPHFSAEAVIGHYTFDPDFSIAGGSFYLKGYLSSSMWRPFLAAGAGAFKPESIDWSLGLSLGLGLNKPIAPPLEADLGIYYFRVFTPGEDLDFLIGKVGLKLVF